MSNKKEAKKNRRAARAFVKEYDSRLKAEAEKKEKIAKEDAAKKVILFNDNLTSLEKVRLMWPRSLPEVPNDNAHKAVKDARNTVLMMFSNILVELGKLNDHNKTVTTLEYIAFTKMYQNDLRELVSFKEGCDELVLNYGNGTIWEKKFFAYCQSCSVAMFKIKKYEESRAAGEFEEDGNELCEVNGEIMRKKDLEIRLTVRFDFASSAIVMNQKREEEIVFI